MDMMINDFLQYSRIQSQDKKFEYLSSEEILKTVLSNLKSLIDDNNAIITYDLLPMINANKQHMIQLFQNIIGNAIKYRSEKNPEIHISADCVDNEYIFCIKDNGIGISPENLERIFKLFQRLHTHEEYEGTGIGLSIAQKIIHHQGGNIWVESEIGKVSTFCFTIPYSKEN